jgi:dipeptidyl aminopeptidase/acylaminoacyl peptidase
MPHSPDSWTRIGAYTSPSFSKDGTRLFHMRGAGLPQPWVMDLDGGNAKPVAQFDEKVAMLRRAPTDDRVILGVDAGGDERQQFHLVMPDGSMRALTSAPDVIHDFGAWSPDATRIAYTANDRDDSAFDVLVMELSTGAITQIREGEGQISVFAWSGEQIAMLEDYSSSSQTLWLIELETGEARAIPAPGPTRYASIRFTPDGALMGLTDHGGSDFMRLCRIDPRNGGVSVVHDAPGRDVEAWSQAPNRGKLAVVENDRGYAVLKVDGVVVEGLPHGIVADLAWSPDVSTHDFTAQSPVDPPGIWLWRDGTATPLLRPDPLAEAGIDPAVMVAPTLVEWKGEDGMTIPGWLAFPRGPKPATGHPAVVWVHGGPVGQTRANFRADTQMLLDQGFAVLLPNVRGSSGYGRAYMESDDVALRPAALADLAQGRHFLAALPEIDAARIGVMGQSYGGWMVLGAITLYPELWTAAVDYYGIADFVTLLDKTGPWRRNHRAREYGFPGTDDALFAQISPIHHVHRVTAPLLVAHGNRDPRVPKNESDQFVTAMQERQMKVRYEEFDYAGHGFIRPDHRTRIFNAVAAHFLEHMA